MQAVDITLRHFLRRATADDHARAEAVHWNGSAFHDHSAYLTFLCALKSAHLHLGGPAAAALDRHSEVVRHSACVSLISADLGPHDMAAHEPAPLPILTPSIAWGVTYALVGSALGAASILKRFAQDQQTWPHAYLRASHDFATTGGVQTLFRALDSADVNHSQCLIGAQLVFQCIEKTTFPHPPRAASRAADLDQQKAS